MVHFVHVKYEIQFTNILETSIQCFHKNLYKHVNFSKFHLGLNILILLELDLKFQVRFLTNRRKTQNTVWHNVDKSVYNRNRLSGCHLLESCKHCRHAWTPVGMFPLQSVAVALRAKILQIYFTWTPSPIKL